MTAAPPHGAARPRATSVSSWAPGSNPRGDATLGRPRRHSTPCPPSSRARKGQPPTLHPLSPSSRARRGYERQRGRSLWLQCSADSVDDRIDVPKTSALLTRSTRMPEALSQASRSASMSARATCAPPSTSTARPVRHIPPPIGRRPLAVAHARPRLPNDARSPSSLARRGTGGGVSSAPQPLLAREEGDRGAECQFSSVGPSSLAREGDRGGSWSPARRRGGGQGGGGETQRRAAGRPWGLASGRRGHRSRRRAAGRRFADSLQKAGSLG